MKNQENKECLQSFINIIESDNISKNKADYTQQHKEKLKYSLDNWIKKTKLDKESISIFQQGEEDGLTPNDFKDLKDYNKIIITRIFIDWNKIINKSVFNLVQTKITKEKFLSKYKLS